MGTFLHFIENVNWGGKTWDNSLTLSSKAEVAYALWLRFHT